MSDHHEKRKHGRIAIRNLLSQVSTDKNGCCVGQGIGRALDVSQRGLKLETSYPVNGHLVSLMTVDLDDSLIEISGRPMYCRQVAPGRYHTGLEFIGLEAEVKTFAMQMVRVYHHRKNKTYIRIDD